VRTNNSRVQVGPLCIETVRGEPYVVGGRKLTPVARVIYLGRARGIIRTDSVGGWGAGFAWVRPLAVVGETADGERILSITDSTRSTLVRLVLAVVAITLVFSAIRRLVRHG
jgi:uncharacterized spore protein YtfJ